MRTRKPEARISAHVYECFGISGNSSLYDQGYQIGKDANDGTGYKHKYQYTSNPFLKVGVFTKEMSRIEQETHEENDP